MEEKKINTLPAPTWHWLKMNGESVAFPKTFFLAKPLRKKNTLNFNLNAGENLFFENEIHLKEGEEKTLIMEYEGGENSFFSVKTNVHLEKNSRLRLVKIQMLKKGAVRVDQTFSKLQKNAEFEFSEIELGGEKNYSEFVCDLEGESAKLKTSLCYFLFGKNLLDINFVSNQSGKKTQSQMDFAGSLKDNAKKTFRKTIDFKKGCCAGKGCENEEALLLSENVTNKSIPLILCAEEDVLGEHGVSAGGIAKDVLFYMGSRGIKKNEAQKILSRAKIERVLSEVKDEEAAKKTRDFLDEIFEKNF